MWHEIKRTPGCKSVRPPGAYGEMLVLPVPPDEMLKPSYWFIGQYKDQTRMALR